MIILTLVSMESSHLVIFSTSGKFITKFNVLPSISLNEILFWTGARGRIPITLNGYSKPNSTIKFDIKMTRKLSSLYLCCYFLSFKYALN